MDQYLLDKLLDIVDDYIDGEKECYSSGNYTKEQLSLSAGKIDALNYFIDFAKKSGPDKCQDDVSFYMSKIREAKDKTKDEVIRCREILDYKYKCGIICGLTLCEVFVKQSYIDMTRMILND